MLASHSSRIDYVHHNDILNTISRNREEYLKYIRYFDDDSKLFRENILDRDLPVNPLDDPDPWIKLHRDFVRSIFDSDI
jgi:hypothetical protein